MTRALTCYNSGMSMPGAQAPRIDEDKIVGYLLNGNKSGGKAEFFHRMGFTRERWEVLRERLAEHGRENPVVSAVESPY